MQSIWHWCDGLVGSVVVVFSWRVAEAGANFFFCILLSAWFHFQAMIVLEKKDRGYMVVLGKKERLCCSVLHLQCDHFGCSFQFYRLSATRSVDLLGLNFDLGIKTVFAGTSCISLSAILYMILGNKSMQLRIWIQNCFRKGNFMFNEWILNSVTVWNGN